MAYLGSFVVEEERFQCYWDTTNALQIVNTTPLLFHFSARHANTQRKSLFSLNTAGHHNLAEVIVIYGLPIFHVSAWKTKRFFASFFTICSSVHYYLGNEINAIRFSLVTFSGKFNTAIPSQLLDLPVLKSVGLRSKLNLY